MKKIIDLVNCNSITKKTLFVLAFFVFIFVELMIVQFYTQRNMFIESQKNGLRILADEKVSQINIFLNSEKEKLSLLASLDVFKNLILHPKDKTLYASAKETINKIKNILPGIGVFTKNGIIVVAENNASGTDYSSSSFFPAGDNMTIFLQRYYDSQRKKEYYGIVGPVYDSIQKNKVIGVIGYDIEVSKISSILAQSLNTGDEVYFIDKDGIILADADRTIDDTGYKMIEQKKGAAKDCIDDINKYSKYKEDISHQENISQYINYHNLDVFGTHSLVTGLSGCIISEKKSEEILKYSMIDYMKKIFNPYIK
jgi:C4-dicarboxylate-specific signal transduction histidine kinase